MNKFDNKNIFRNPYYSKLFLIIQERKEVYFMDKSKSNTDSEARSLTLWKISIAVILFFIAGLFIGMEPFKTITYICAAGILGYDIVISFIKSIMNSSVSVNKSVKDGLLSAIASAGLFIIGKPSGAVGVMLFFKALSFISNSAYKKASSSSDVLNKLCSDYANVQYGDEFIRTPVNEISCGDIIVVKSGEIFPLDGIVTTGESLMDSRRFTGEASHRTIGPGSEVISGARNAASPVYVKVTRTSKNSAAYVIKETTEHYLDNRSLLENTFMTYAPNFTAGAVIASAVLIIVSFFVGMGEILRYYGLILLSVSSAFFTLKSVQTGFLAASGRLIKDGILIKSPKFVEAAATIKKLVFDKNVLTSNNKEHEDSIVAVSGFAARGIETILTSDSAALPERNELLNKIAGHTGIDKVFLNIEDKKLQSLLSSGYTAFYGSRTNKDYNADIVISQAEHNTAEIIRSADAVLMTNEPSKLLRLYDTSKKTYKAAGMSILITCIIKLIIIALMILGKAEIWQALILDSLGSLAAIKLSLNIRKIKKASR